jgi:hypothetical protein
VAVEVLGRQLLERLRPVCPGARNQDFDGPQPLLAGGHDPRTGAWFRDVDRDRFDDAPSAGAVGGHCFERLRVTRNKQHLRALGRKHAGGRLADAAARAGHHARPAAQPEIH